MPKNIKNNSTQKKKKNYLNIPIWSPSNTHQLVELLGFINSSPMFWSSYIIVISQIQKNPSWCTNSSSPHFLLGPHGGDGPLSDAEVQRCHVAEWREASRIQLLGLAMSSNNSACGCASHGCAMPWMRHAENGCGFTMALTYLWWGVLDDIPLQKKWNLQKICPCSSER